MCIVIHPKAKIRTATKDITVYKIVHNYNELNCCISVYTDYVYKQGIIKKTYVKFPTCKKRKKNISLHKGFHSIVKLCEAKSYITQFKKDYPFSFLANKRYIAKFIIPKGSKYILGRWGDNITQKNYLSNKIKFVKFL